MKKKTKKKIKILMCIFTMVISFLIVQFGTWLFMMITFLSFREGNSQLAVIFGMFTVSGLISIYYSNRWMKLIKEIYFKPTIR